MFPLLSISLLRIRQYGGGGQEGVSVSHTHTHICTRYPRVVDVAHVDQDVANKEKQQQNVEIKPQQQDAATENVASLVQVT